MAADAHWVGRRTDPPMLRIRMLTWAAVVAVFLLMSIGNVVSATGSGLACPDWPLCHGSLIPPLRPDVLIEYSHRLVAALASILIVATIVMAMRRSGQPAMRRMGWTLLVLLAAQIGLGGITVLLKLPDLISTAHLVNALLIFGGLLVLAASERGAGHPRGRDRAPGSGRARRAPRPARAGRLRAPFGRGARLPGFPAVQRSRLAGPLAGRRPLDTPLARGPAPRALHPSRHCRPRHTAGARDRRPRRCSPSSRWPSASRRSCSGSTRRSAPPTPPSATPSGGRWCGPRRDRVP